MTSDENMEKIKDAKFDEEAKSSADKNLELSRQLTETRN